MTADTDDAPLTPEQFQARANVSRETMDRLRAYADHLTARQAVQNLVSRNSLPHLWDRHMLDSIQLVPHLPAGAESITDIGSGAGFPGIVLAIATGLPVDLIEAHGRKCAFLAEVAALTEAPVTVLNDRVGTIADSRRDAARYGESAKISVDILTVRALAPLAKLCEMAESLDARTCLFLKGGRWRDELTEAEKHWKMRVETFDSLTSPEGRILRITELRPK